MSAPTVAALIAEARAHHRQSSQGNWCDSIWCGAAWPCVTARLANALEAAQRDTPRLDWLDRQRYDERNPRGKEDDPPDYCSWTVLGQTWDVRAAIDAAIAQEGAR